MFSLRIVLRETMKQTTNNKLRKNKYTEQNKVENKQNKRSKKNNSGALKVMSCHRCAKKHHGWTQMQMLLAEQVQISYLLNKEKTYRS